MPFVALANGIPDPASPITSVRLEHLPSSRWLLVFARTLWRQLDGIAYILPGDVEYPSLLTRRSSGDDGRRSQWVAPAHGGSESTDLASVPPWLWGVIASFGRHTMPALVHDRLCLEAAEFAEAGDREEAARLRWEADWLFRVGLDEEEVPWAQRWVMWAAVRLFGAARLERSGQLAVVAALIGAISTALGALAALGVVGRIAPPPPDVTSWLVGTIATAIGLVAVTLAAIRRRDLAGAILVATLAGPVAIPALLVSLGSTLLLWLPTAVGWALRQAMYWLGVGVVWLANRLGGSMRRPRKPGPLPPMGPTNY